MSRTLPYSYRTSLFPMYCRESLTVERVSPTNHYTVGEKETYLQSGWHEKLQCCRLGKCWSMIDYHFISVSVQRHNKSGALSSTKATSLY